MSDPTPDKIRRYNLGLLRPTHAYGSELAEQLLAGDPSGLPGTAEDFILRHSLAVQFPALTGVHNELHDALAPPYDAAKAKHIGSLVSGAVTLAADYVTAMRAVEMSATEMFGGDPLEGGF